MVNLAKVSKLVSTKHTCTEMKGFVYCWTYRGMPLQRFFQQLHRVQTWPIWALEALGPCDQGLTFQSLLPGREREGETLTENKSGE